MEKKILEAGNGCDSPCYKLGNLALIDLLTLRFLSSNLTLQYFVNSKVHIFTFNIYEIQDILQSQPSRQVLLRWLSLAKQVLVKLAEWVLSFRKTSWRKWWNSHLRNATPLMLWLHREWCYVERLWHWPLWASRWFGNTKLWKSKCLPNASTILFHLYFHFTCAQIWYMMKAHIKMSLKMLIQETESKNSKW